MAYARINNQNAFPFNSDQHDSSKGRGTFTQGPRMTQPPRFEVHVPQPRVSLEDNVTQAIRQAEASKARILASQGNCNDNTLPTLSMLNNFQTQPSFNHRESDRLHDVNSSGDNQGLVLFGPNQFMRTAIMDKDYLIVAAHVDEVLERRIRNGEFIDFARLLPRDRVQMQQDERIELINHNGHLSCTPASNSTSSSEFSINSFARWEQAFRVFSNIYTRQYPQKASELIQYNHVIHIAAMTYSWSNVYSYDIDFRLHMARHPQRSWSVILQQAWNLRLKDKNDSGGDRRRSSPANANGSSGGKHREICFRYNAGKCTYGSRCKFDHRCGICGKHGHGAHNCRRSNNWNRDSFDKSDKQHNDK